MLALVGVLVLAAASNAPVEFCPAAIAIRAQGVHHKYQDQLPRSAQYGFQVSAEGPRVITSAKVAFETDAGWFTLDVPAVSLTEKILHFPKPMQRVAERTFVSPVMFAKFAAPLRIWRVWVLSAAASGDTLGWSSKGTVQCEPAPVRDMHGFDPSIDEIGGDDLGSQPPIAAEQVVPQPSAAIASANCRNAFDDIKPFSDVLPDGADNIYHPGNDNHVLVKAAIDASGHVVAAWIASSSGYADFDRAALAAPLRAAFQPGRAYCHNVPGILQWMFDMRSIYNYEHRAGN